VIDLPHGLVVISALACAVLIYGEYRRNDAVRVAAKLVASAAFVALGFVLLPSTDDPARAQYAGTILGGLVFGAIGDAALLGKSSKAFMAGLVAFLFGHLAYVVAVSFVLPPAHWLTGAGALGFAVPPMIAGGVALAWLWPHLGSMRVPVIAYVLTIVTMVVAALAVFRTHALPSPQRTWLLFGAVLFFISDLAVARDKFVRKGFANRAWGLPTYYAGQLMIAWSLAGL
jgi:uncharacterized membrane protein YhhN